MSVTLSKKSATRGTGMTNSIPYELARISLLASKLLENSVRVRTLLFGCVGTPGMFALFTPPIRV